MTTEDLTTDLPWLCRTCGKTYPACGKSIGLCEREVWKENEYEKAHP
jgi:hypothetical protein